ncbi:SRPBCC family protein [Amycolatopsis sp. FDAARGOS 1241]|uniref:SRPBCC family protein n=1 Tax=Amycolatopsis sp. FDAARGOS 1241 TaxID=2778070 RepID=UPI001951F1ED|nr:SRPBCC family protein [Amycolatopsis sp. FDAARGOS 1241]QRP44892.1 SRPBCC family protein [Amycolatopsis sp. FDAARGOS 1241]
MTDVKHATFTLERHYPVSPAKVFAAWADPAVKAGWFGAGDHSLDFRVGGRETNRAGDFTFTSDYHDIVDGERIVYASTLSGGAGLATVSVTTVELVPDGSGTRLVLTEQGTFLDGHEEPEWRERGTGDWLDKLGGHLGA